MFTRMHRLWDAQAVDRLQNNARETESHLVRPLTIDSDKI
jgi:hypothetical protein